MDGVADMQQRIAQISAQLAALSANANRPVPSTSGTSSATAGAAGGSGAAAASGSFGSALSDAMAARTSGLGGGGLGGGGLPGTGSPGSGDVSAGSAGTAEPVLSTLTASTLTASTLTSALTSPGLTPTTPNAATTRAATSAYGAAPTAPGTAPVTTAPVSAPAGAPRAAAPDLSSYGNGRIPIALLERIGVGDHRLAAPAADGFRSMLAAARRDGVRIGVNDSYRSYDQQVHMARRKGLYSEGGLAAKPGTSDHGWGRSVDLQLDSRALRWMRTHADEYGFSANVPRESWHWTYVRRS